MSKLSNILSYVLYALILLTAVFTVMFFSGGDVPDQTYQTPVYTDLLLNWAKILCAATAVITILFEIFHIIVNPKNAVRSLISIGVLIVIALISYSLADGTPLKLATENADNVYPMLKLAGAFLYGTYALLGMVIVAIFATEISRLFK